jgi:hypothetical protein
MKDLNNLLKILLENDIDFVVIGGFAGAFYGSSLLTKDLDICMACSPESVQKLRILLKDHHPVHRMTPEKLSFLEHPEKLDGLQNLYLTSDLGSLDVLSNVIGVGDFEKIKSNAFQTNLFGHSCKIISIDDLISSKKAMKRDKDKIAVQELEIIKEKKKTKN